MKMFTKFKTAGLAFLTAAVIVVSGLEYVPAAITPITVDENEYNVYVEEMPGSVSTVYAKFNSKRSNVDTYLLSMYDDYESEEIIEAALKKSGDDIENYEILCMDINLYQEDAESDYYPVTSNIDMTIISEVPSEFAELESKVKIFAVNSTGKIDNIAYTLVDVDGYICMQFTIKRFTQYAFALSLKDIEAYENEQYGYDEEGDDFDDVDGEDITPTEAPTKAPTKAPTAAPTQAPSPTKAPAPTTKPSSTTNQGNVNNGTTSGKDSVPQTGEETGNGGIVTTAAAGLLLAATFVYIKKNNK